MTEIGNKKLVIFGTGEIASLARFYFDQDSDYEVVGFAVDDSYCESERFDGLPLVPWSRVGVSYPSSEFEMHVALSYMKLNQLREEKYHQAKAAGYTLASYICSKSVTWPDLVIGDNCFILENQTIQPTCKIGNNVMLWSGNHIGHGSIIGAHTYIASHAVVSGHCVIGERCFIGVNATLKDFLTVGDDCFITMDASVTSNLAEGSVVLGKAGDLLEGSDRRARMIKKKYFKL
jgi:sugar O-acyltransferase (sialic acid O-acetyltransferase NeuD family)